jgi:hypothetical protein
MGQVENALEEKWEVDMNNKVLLGLWRMMIPIPGMVWQREAFEVAKQTVARIGFMSEEHHLIRDFVVRELPCVGEPLAPEVIACAGNGWSPFWMRWRGT